MGCITYVRFVSRASIGSSRENGFLAYMKEYNEQTTVAITRIPELKQAAFKGNPYRSHHLND